MVPHTPASCMELDRSITRIMTTSRREACPCAATVDPVWPEPHERERDGHAGLHGNGACLIRGFRHGSSQRQIGGAPIPGWEIGAEEGLGGGGSAGRLTVE